MMVLRSIMSVVLGVTLCILCVVHGTIPFLRQRESVHRTQPSVVRFESDNSDEVIMQVTVDVEGMEEYLKDNKRSATASALQAVASTLKLPTENFQFETFRLHPEYYNNHLRSNEVNNDTYFNQYVVFEMVVNLPRVPHGYTKDTFFSHCENLLKQAHDSGSLTVNLQRMLSTSVRTVVGSMSKVLVRKVQGYIIDDTRRDDYDDLPIDERVVMNYSHVLSATVLIMVCFLLYHVCQRISTGNSRRSFVERSGGDLTVQHADCG